jgi:predicted enzyme related to lactoylglutathione lyase
MATETTPAPATATEAETASHTICHVEIPAQDPDKLRAFYTDLFGWKFEGMPGMPEYTTAMLGSGDAAVGLAVFKKESEFASPTNYIAVASADAHAAKIEQLGGKVLHRFVVPHMGRGAIATDPEGNLVGLWQNDPTATE